VAEHRADQRIHVTIDHRCTSHAHPVRQRADHDVDEQQHALADSSSAVFGESRGGLIFERDQVLSLIADCAARFPGGQLFFDSIPTSLRAYRVSDRYTAPPMPFGFSVSAAARLPGAGSVEDRLPPLGRGAWGSRALRRIAVLPGLRDLRPSISLVGFAQR
jgi:hypothetical protein